MMCQKRWGQETTGYWLTLVLTVDTPIHRDDDGGGDSDGVDDIVH